MHVRLREPDTSFHALIANGITSVRAMYSGTPVAEYEAWRLHADAIRIAAGGLIQGVVDPDAAKLAVRVIAANRADFVQVSNELSRDAYFAIADETRRLGTSFAGPVPESVSLAEASKAAQLSVEGLSGFLRECPENCGALLETLADNGTFVTPLLAASQYRGSPVQLVQQMQQAGIHILAGSDASRSSQTKLGGDLHEELNRLVDSGLTPLEALQAATRNPALYFGTLTLMGTVEKGKAADLVLLDENPLEDIRNTRKIRAVFVRGKYYSREALDH